jgi:ubiquinone/menaquinone biosynthesis C-methylase UbiE
MPEASFDSVADRYDATRGGEPRGLAYASELAHHLEVDRAVVDLGTGTGVVALGLRRLGFDVVGVDISPGMLSRAIQRLGPCVVQGDTGQLPLASNSVDQAVAVWVVHAVGDPADLFAEAFRALRPGGCLLVCPVNRPAHDDPVGLAFDSMARRVEEMTGKKAAGEIQAGQVLAWAESAGFAGRIDPLPEQSWVSSTEEEIEAVVKRSWSGLVPLDDEQFDIATHDMLATLRAIPPGPIRRNALADVVVLRAPSQGR